MKISELKGLGEKSEACLREVEIETVEQLREIGAVQAYIRVKDNSTRLKPSLNLLYALVGALEDTNWQSVAKEQRGRLLMEIEDYQEHQKLLKD